MAAPRRTKIVATIGPASSEPAVLEQLMGLIDGARLNFSHGTHEEHRARAELIRNMQEQVTRPVALIADLQGPKLRIGELPEPVVLGSVLQPGFDVLIDDGAVRLRVGSVERGRARCEGLVGGVITSNKGV